MAIMKMGGGESSRFDQFKPASAPTKKATIPLADCLQCGGPAEVLRRGDGGQFEPGAPFSYQAMCCACGMRGSPAMESAGPDSAIEGWNRIQSILAAGVAAINQKRESERAQALLATMDKKEPALLPQEKPSRVARLRG